MIARRGVALIVVLWAILLLATITAAASSAARGSADVTAGIRAASVASAMAESGILASSTRLERSLVEFHDDSLARDALLAAITQNGSTPFDTDTLGDGVFATTVLDVSAQLDLNNAGAEGLYLLFRQFAPDGDARRTANAIDARIRGEVAPAGSAAARDADILRARDSLVASLLGRPFDASNGAGTRRAIESLDELADIPDVDVTLIARVAPLLTVDGDGNVNRSAAPKSVLAAASGSLVDRPTRLLVISRGWMRGSALTRQIEAVYDLSGDGLRLVRWREHER